MMNEIQIQEFSKALGLVSLGGKNIFKTYQEAEAYAKAETKDQPNKVYGIDQLWTKEYGVWFNSFD